MLIGLMSLKNPLVYIQFHPVTYMVKLNIEMTMAALITKIARGAETEIVAGATSSHHSMHQLTMNSRANQQSSGRGRAGDFDADADADIDIDIEAAAEPPPSGAIIHKETTIQIISSKGGAGRHAFAFPKTAAGHRDGGALTDVQYE